MRRLVIDRPVVPERVRHDKRKPPRAAAPEASPKDRAQELVDSGMPYQMAMAVVHGKMELNEALERLSRRDRINQLMERHGLSRALATQVAVGHADLKLLLHRRRLLEHREQHRDRTCLQAGATLALARFGGDAVKLTVGEVDAYTVNGTDDKGAATSIHKLELKFAYAPDDWKKVRKALRKDKALADQGLLPAKQPQDRYTCSDKRIFGFLDGAREVSVTLVDGDAFRGTITWFSRYEFGLSLRGDAEITVFRHALHELAAA